MLNKNIIFTRLRDLKTLRTCSYFLTLILILTFGTANAHQDFWITENFGNIKVRIKTGFAYEEINKVFIIGELTEKFASQIGYKDQIFLYFDHHYVGDCEPDYFISFDKGANEDTKSGHEKRKAPLSKKSIVIRQVSRQFDAITTLELVKYAITNLPEVKLNQKYIDYNQNYCHWRIQTIDTLKIRELLNKPQTQDIKLVGSTKIERPEKDLKYGITYYYQDSLFNVVHKDYNQNDTVLLSVNNIFQLNRPTNVYFPFIFDTDSTFYFFSSREKVSKRHLINDTHYFYEPFNIEHIGGGMYAIYFWYYSKEIGVQPRHKTLIYLSETDELIQDLKQLIEINK